MNKAYLWEIVGKKDTLKGNSGNNTCKLCNLNSGGGGEASDIEINSHILVAAGGSWAVGFEDLTAIKIVLC